MPIHSHFPGRLVTTLDSDAGPPAVGEEIPRQLGGREGCRLAHCGEERLVLFENMEVGKPLFKEVQGISFPTQRELLEKINLWLYFPERQVT